MKDVTSAVAQPNGLSKTQISFVARMPGQYAALHFERGFRMLTRTGFGMSALLAWHGTAFAADVRVTVTGAVPNGTTVYASLCDGGLDETSCKIGMRQVASSSVVVMVFSDVTPSRYAVVAFQDLDGNGSLERSKLGLPLEPYAVSRNAGRQRRPTFQAASFPVLAGETDVALQLHVLKSGNDDRTDR